MRKTVKKYLFGIAVLSVILMPASHFAQEDFDPGQYRVRFDFTTTKQADGSRVLKAEFAATNRKDRLDRVPVYGAEVAFTNVLEDQVAVLGKAKTSKDGIAEITLPGDQEYLTDAEGFINLAARFEGSEALDAESEDLRIRDMRLNIDLVEIDSVKTVRVSSMTTDSLGMDIPANDVFIAVSVDGMLSRMVIGEEFVEDGGFDLDFPEGIPGDENGNVTVFAVIEDNDTFGNVIEKETANWGNREQGALKNTNTLWSEAAPIWMYVVLTILLVGVWANYAYTVVQLLKIKKSGKAPAQETE